MISIRAASVIPEEVPEPGEEEVVVLPEDETVLALEVVGLALRPVEPLDTLVHVRPEPLPGRTLAVSLLMSQNINLETYFVSSSPLCRLPARTGQTPRPQWWTAAQT